MKKLIGIALALFCLLGCTACGMQKAVTLPDARQLSSIEIMQSTGQSGKTYTTQEEMSTFIRCLQENASKTCLESVNDQPVNIEDYIIVRLIHSGPENSASIAYLYTKKGTAYLEQPYAGIWTFNNETFDQISRQVNSLGK